MACEYPYRPRPAGWHRSATLHVGAEVAERLRMRNIPRYQSRGPVLRTDSTRGLILKPTVSGKGYQATNNSQRCDVMTNKPTNKVLTHTNVAYM
jgi:hypothetical protein